MACTGFLFSALEVVPLCLLIWEAYTHYRLYKKSDIAFSLQGTFIFLLQQDCGMQLVLEH